MKKFHKKKLLFPVTAFIVILFLLSWPRGLFSPNISASILKLTVQENIGDITAVSAVQPVAMKKENMNTAFLDGVLKGKYPDVYYHLGVDSKDPILEKIKDVSSIVTGKQIGRAHV